VPSQGSLPASPPSSEVLGLPGSCWGWVEGPAGRARVLGTSAHVRPGACEAQSEMHIGDSRAGELAGVAPHRLIKRLVRGRQHATDKAEAGIGWDCAAEAGGLRCGLSGLSLAPA
jgi:hypothetical protein